MTNELGIELKCENCVSRLDSCKSSQTFCVDNKYKFFRPSQSAMIARIIELQADAEWHVECIKGGARFTPAEAEKIETYLLHGYQLLKQQNKEIFNKLETMKGNANEID